MLLASRASKLTWQLYTYPIKSLRATPLNSARLTPTGFPYDRRFMLLKVHDGEHKQSGTNLQNMIVSHFPEMVLFQQSLQRSSLVPDGDEYDQIVVTYHPPLSSSASSAEIESLSITIPLRPEVTALPQIPVNLYGSRTKGYDMGEAYNEWFTAHFGYAVKLVKLGPNLRPVLGNVPENIQAKPLPKSPLSWLSSLMASIPVLGSWAGYGSEDEAASITFADCAPYLVVSEESLADVSRRLPAGERMDITKFRPNIVISGAETAWEEDYWGRLVFGVEEEGSETRMVELELTANCGRCRSLDVDYASGKFGKGEMGSVLKKLSVDRRVDLGNKWSPVFGRYAFLREGKEVILSIGDNVEVAKRNEERTVFGECLLPQNLTLFCLSRL